MKLLTTPSRLALLWMVAALAACGGGGGGDGTSTNAPPQTSSPTPNPSLPPPPPPPPPASGWQAPLQVSVERDAQTTDINTTALALDDQDRGWMAWAEKASSSCAARLWVARLDAGKWSALELGHATSGGTVQSDVLNVQVAGHTSNGSAVVAWTQRYFDSQCFGIVGSEVWVRRFNGAWLAPERVTAAQGGDSSLYAGDPRVAIDDNGRITVAWVQQQTNLERPTPYARRFEAGMWQPPHRLNAGDRNAQEMAMGVSGSGDVVFAWRQDTNLFDPNQSGGGPSQAAMWSARYVVASGTWSAPLRVGSTLVPYEYEERLHLAVGRGGHAVLVWERQGLADRSIYGVRFDPVAAQWGSAVELDGASTNSSFSSVAVNASGQAQVAWLSNTASAWRDGYTTRWNAGSLPRAPILFETRDQELQVPAVGIDSAGRAVIAWEQAGVRARHVADAGLGPDEVVIQRNGPVAVATNPRGFSIAALPSTWLNLSVPRYETAPYAALYLP
jgi:hypothetical protein